MENHLLRATHEVVMATHYYQTYSKGGAPLIIFLATAAFLIVMAICFLNNVTSMLFEIPVSFSSDKQKTFFIIAIILLVGSGLYSIIVGAWSTHTWYYSGASCLSLGIYFYVYQTGKDFTLLLSSVLMILTTVACYLLSLHTVHDSHHLVILTNIVGAAEAWALIWTLYVLGQFFIYKLDMSRKTQNILFFISVIVLIIVRILSPSFNGKVQITDFIGYLIMAIVLLFFMFDSQRKSLFT